jgi:hypothetical protein
VGGVGCGPVDPIAVCTLEVRNQNQLSVPCRACEEPQKESASTVYRTSSAPNRRTMS